MRTNKTQQDKTRRACLRAAVDLMTQHGFESTTMKQIARAAEVGDATIYKYFPTKEKLVLGYFEQAIADALVQMEKTKGQTAFGLQERMQLLIDSVLELLLADREFVAVTAKLVERTPMLLLSDELPGKRLLKQIFEDLLTQAESSGEIPLCGYKPSVSGLLADYVFAVLSYWLRDESEQFGDTTQLVDLSLGVVVLTLRSGLIDKLLALGGFVLRSQMARLLQSGSGLLDLVKLARRGLDGARA
jgi:TetR/AcrR family transcriptional regulator of autoinduction and epiphytic fitness